MKISALVTAFGSQARLARAAEAGGQSTVSNWIAAGRIPYRRRVAIVRNSIKFGVKPVDALRLVGAELLEAAGVTI